MQRRGNYRIGVAGVAVFIGFMVLLAAFCGWLWNRHAAGQPVAAFGYEWMPLGSDGMEPAVPKGSLLLLREASEPDAGDIIVAGRENGKGGTAFRVLERQQNGLLAKEDRAGSSEEIPAGEPLYEVAYSLPYLGYVLDFLLTAKGLVIVIAVPCLLFFVLELIGLLRISRHKNPLLEQPGGLSAKLPAMTEEDERENFVDVTAEYTTGRKKYRSPLREEMEEEEPEDKFADLDFNPLMRGSSPLETVEIPDAPPERLQLLVNGKEAASVPLENHGNFSVKNGSWRIDISVARDDGAGK